MKKLIKVSILSVLLAIGFNAHSQIPSIPSVCCSVSCKNGSCTANSTPCVCECSFWGNPSCGGGSNIISINDIQNSNISLCITYLNNLGTSNSLSAATHLSNYRTAVLANNQTLASTELSSYVVNCENLTGLQQTSYKNYIITLPNS